MYCTCTHVHTACLTSQGAQAASKAARKARAKAATASRVAVKTLLKSGLGWTWHSALGIETSRPLSLSSSATLALAPTRVALAWMRDLNREALDHAEFRYPGQTPVFVTSYIKALKVCVRVLS